MRDWLKKAARLVKDNRGFTVAELLVALSVLTVALLAFIPLFVHISEGSQANRARLVATNLASSVIEEIRGLPYNDIGLVNGNPRGVVEPFATVTIDGLTYTVETRIWWVEDTSDDADGSDPVPYDYKRVQVTVSAPGLFTGRVTMTVDIHTLSSMEGEEEAFPGGNIRAEAYRGWQTDPGDPVPVEDVRIDLTDGPDAPQTQWTDEAGKVLFAILDAGTYTVEADASSLGMIVRPDQVQQEAEVVEAITTPVIFELEYPCRLALELRDAETTELISTGGSVTLKHEELYREGLTAEFTAEMNGMLPGDLLGDLWPLGKGYPGHYDLVVSAHGYLEYELGEDVDAPWDGTFSGPGEHRTVTIYLSKANVTVSDAAYGTPVVGAAVDIYLRTYTYQGGNWVEKCEWKATALTEENGRASFVLEKNEAYAPPETPAEGDEYTRYCVKVTADRYTAFGPERGVFWVTGGRQMDENGQIETYTVYLEPVS